MLPNSNGDNSLLTANSTRLNLHLDESIKFKYRQAIGVRSIEENKNHNNPFIQNENVQNQKK
jgi:hypothetical protein